MRMQLFGYQFYLDQSIEYRALHHERLSPEWDEKYKQGIEYFNKCVYEMKQGTRAHLDYLTR